MSPSPVKYWLALVCLLAAMYGSFVVWRGRHDSQNSSPQQPQSSAPADPSSDPAAAEFVLKDQNGQKFDSHSLEGKVWVGSFFFTNCPSACWRLNQALAAIQQTSPESQVRYVSITCDPDNDTPDALLKYAENFKADPARWTFLTGDFKTIRRIGNEFFKVAVEKGTHSDRAFVVDRQGQVRGRFRLTEPDQVEMLKKLIATVEAEPPSAAAAADGVQPDVPAEKAQASD